MDNQEHTVYHGAMTIVQAAGADESSRLERTERRTS